VWRRDFDELVGLLERQSYSALRPFLAQVLGDEQLQVPEEFLVNLALFAALPDNQQLLFDGAFADGFALRAFLRSALLDVVAHQLGDVRLVQIGVLPKQWEEVLDYDRGAPLPPPLGVFSGDLGFPRVPTSLSDGEGGRTPNAVITFILSEPVTRRFPVVGEG
jgi:hypothetical protein